MSDMKTDQEFKKFVRAVADVTPEPPTITTRRRGKLLVSPTAAAAGAFALVVVVVGLAIALATNTATTPGPAATAPPATTPSTVPLVTTPPEGGPAAFDPSTLGDEILPSRLEDPELLSDERIALILGPGATLVGSPTYIGQVKDRFGYALVASADGAEQHCIAIVAGDGLGQWGCAGGGSDSALLANLIGAPDDGAIGQVRAGFAFDADAGITFVGIETATGIRLWQRPVDDAAFFAFDDDSLNGRLTVKGYDRDGHTVYSASHVLGSGWPTLGEQPEVTDSFINPPWVTVDSEDYSGILERVLSNNDLPEVSDTMVTSVLENLPADGWTPFRYSTSRAGDLVIAEGLNVQLGNKDSLDVNWRYRWSNSPECSVCTRNQVPWENGWMVWTDTEASDGNQIVMHASHRTLPFEARIWFAPDPIEWPEPGPDAVLQTSLGDAEQLAQAILNSISTHVLPPE